jgi:anti-anti-sigma regulatory factor
MSFSVSEAGAAMFELPPVLDLPAAHDLSIRLQEVIAVSNHLVLDAANVQRFTTPCLQVLAAAALPDASGNRAISIRNLPDAMSEAVAVLGLSTALAIEGEE